MSLCSQKYRLLACLAWQRTVSRPMIWYKSDDELSNAYVCPHGQSPIRLENRKLLKTEGDRYSGSIDIDKP